MASITAAVSFGRAVGRMAAEVAHEERHSDAVGTATCPSSTASRSRHRAIASVPSSACITAVNAAMSSAADAFLRRPRFRIAVIGAELDSV